MSLLTADGVTVRRGGKIILDDVSVSFPGGVFVAVIGANGAGKSTLLSVLAGLLRPDKGEAKLDGRPMAGLDRRELARRRAQWKPRAPHFTRGYGRLFLDHVLQAHEGCDFDFLRGKTPVRVEDTAGPSHS